MRNLFFLLVASSLLVGCGKKDRGSTDVYDVVVRTIDGKVVRLKDHRRKVIIVDFWATWCKPCRKSIPDFNRLKREFGDDLFILGLSKDDSPQDVKAFMREIPVDYPVAMATRRLEERFGGILGLPTAFLIDREGRIVKKVLGYKPYDFWKDNVKSLLKR
ncbi:MAG: TlpA family protein disulfide reductase [Thermotogae bacterium]|nr:TlpA family protein disulfide reductase [Thermotogota bacterium]